MPHPLRIKTGLAASACLFGVLLPLAPQAAAADAPAAPAAWLDTLKFSGHLDAGITFNPSAPAGAENIGSLFTDKADEPLLNQLMLTAERPVDTKSSDFDDGFKLQGLFGSDGRYTHALAELDHLVRSRYQPDIVEATFTLHAPILTDDGVDFKIGEFPSPMGAEVIDATGNYLYSHSYIFNFGVPVKNTGFLSTVHVNPVLDLYAGLDTGVNGWIGDNGFNNDIVKGQMGLGLNLFDGDLTVLGFSHIGAENPPGLGVPRDSLRYLNDITTTWKVNDDLTLVNDANYIADQGLRAIGYGMAQYGIYTLCDRLSLIGRIELWRDNGGAFVGAFPGNFDYINAQRGLPASVITEPRTTYSEITVGLNWKPEVPKPVEGFVIRPELRVDHSLNGSHPFDVDSAGIGKDSTSFTPAVDMVLPF